MRWWQKNTLLTSNGRTLHIWNYVFLNLIDSLIVVNAVKLSVGVLKKEENEVFLVLFYN
jgi:hypothetical protein